MAFSTGVRVFANRLLGLGNLRLETLTAERAEGDRLNKLVNRGHFEKPIFPLLRQFSECDPWPILEQVKRDEARFAALTGGSDANAFKLDNAYYTTPDAEVLYAVVRLYRPQRVVEVGSGHSTQLFKLAIRDAGLATTLVSIDPNPRRNVTEWADEIIQSCVEDLTDFTCIETLVTNDILFIDSSHSVEIGNDVLCLLLDLLPRLCPGVLVHLHDIFLPYEYPSEWMVENRWSWNEQYLLQAVLQGSKDFEVLWPGHYLQRTTNSFGRHFVQLERQRASAVWLRRLN